MELSYFLFGYLFATYLAPGLEGICELFLAWIESKKVEYGLVVNKANIEMRKAVEEEPPHRQIGFVIPEYEEEE